MKIQALWILLIWTVRAEAESWQNAPFARTTFLQDWNRDPRRDFGRESMRLVSDPAKPSSREKVLRIFYRRGSYSRSRSFIGSQFYSRPTRPKECVTLEYKIYFAHNFNFVKGGKLPGLWGGSQSCTGSRDATDCFSTRYMWRRRGAGVVYAYIPDNQPNGFCARREVTCNFDYGHDVGGTWVFKTGIWQTISQTIKLNTIGQANGTLKVKFSDRVVLNINNLVFRNSPDVKIEGIFFSTFFGGGSKSWASRRSTYTYYKDFKLTEWTASWQNAPFARCNFLQDWKIDPARDFGRESIRIVNDPANPTSKQKVMRVSYRRGSYFRSSSCSRCLRQGRVQFCSRPVSSSSCLTLEYKLFFANNFDFVKGGTLPGLWGGSLTCSGGRDAVDCFSARYMWRKNGVGVVYAYIPDNQPDGFCARREVKCNFDYGHDVGRTWFFQKGRWQTISQTIKLNTIGQTNGSLKVTFIDRVVLNIRNFVFRNNQDVKIEGIFFATFFGGRNRSWASKKNTYAYYKDFKLTEC